MNLFIWMLASSLSMVCSQDHSVATHATVTPEPAPTTLHSLAWEHISFYNLSKLETLSVTIVQASFLSPHSNTFATFCLVANVSSTIEDCQQMCQTAIVPELTTNPVWNHHCTLKPTVPIGFVLIQGVW